MQLNLHIAAIFFPSSQPGEATIYKSLDILKRRFKGGFTDVFFISYSSFGRSNFIKPGKIDKNQKLLSRYLSIYQCYCLKNSQKVITTIYSQHSLANISPCMIFQFHNIQLKMFQQIIKNYELNRFLDLALDLA